MVTKNKKKNLHILFLKFPLESSAGGGEEHTITLANALVKKGAGVFLASSCRVLLREFEKRDFPAQRTWGGIEPVSKSGFVWFFLTWPFALVQMWCILARYKKKEGIHLVYCLSLTEKILATLPAKFLSLQVVWAEHLSIKKWLSMNPLRIFYVWFSRYVEIIVVSQSLRKELEGIGVPKSQIHVFFNGIDEELFSRSQDALVKGVDLAQLKDRKVVGCVARLHHEKGIDCFLRAAHEILQNDKKIYFFIIGTGEEYPRLLRLAKRLGINEQVFFFGWRDNVVPFLKLMNVFVLPSTVRESFGISIAEAMSMEIPVVASRIGGVPELVEEGKTGYLVEPGNSREITQAVMRFLDNEELAKAFGRRGRDRIKAYFTLDKLVQRTTRLFNHMIRLRPFRALFLKFPYSSAFGGGELHTIQLAERLLKRGADIFLVSSCNVLLREFQKRRLYVEKAYAGLEVVSKLAIILFPFTFFFIYIRLSWLLLRYRLFYKVDVLYCMSLNEKLLATIPARILGIRVYWVEHLLIERWLLQNPFRFLYIWMSRFVRVIAVSHAVKTQLENLGVREKNLHVIYNGIDVNEFQEIAMPSKIAHLAIDEIQNDRYPVVGTMSRLAPEKGIRYLLQAAERVITNMPRALFVIIGEGPERRYLEDLARKLGIYDHIFFLGFLPHKEALGVVSALDIFTLTPISGESFGIAVAEAMMLQKSVVATDIGGISEVVEDNKTGIIVRSKDVEGISNAIMRLAAYRDESLEMGLRGKARVQDKFTLDRMTQRFYQLFSL